MRKNTPVLLATLLLGVGGLTIIRSAAAADCANSFECYGNTGNSLSRVATRQPPILPPSRHQVSQRLSRTQAARQGGTPRINQPARATQQAQAATPQTRPVQRLQTRANATPQQGRTSPDRAVAQTQNRAEPQARNAPAARPVQPVQNRAVPQARNAPAARPVQPVQNRAVPQARTDAPPPQVRAVPRNLPPPPAPIDANCRLVQQNLMRRAEHLESQGVLASRNNDRSISVRLFRDAAEARRRAGDLNCR